jgi:hypothetical protein
MIGQPQFGCGADNVNNTPPAAAKGSTSAAGRGRNAQGTGEELQRRQIDNFEDRYMSGTSLRVRKARRPQAQGFFRTQPT